MTEYKTQRAARKAWKAAIEKQTKKKGAYLIQIQHDDWCGVYSGQECNCNPDRVMLDANGKEIIKVSGAGFYDPLSL
jgi:hypothetical protein